MPWVDNPVKAVLLLYQRCKERGVLPEAGGLLDQDERIMRQFDVIDGVIAEHRRKRNEETELKMRGERVKGHAGR